MFRTKKSWEKIRAKGKTYFVLSRGLFWGFMSLVLITIAAIVSRPSPKWSPQYFENLFSPQSLFLLILAILLLLGASCFWQLYLWHLNEKIHSEPK